MPRFLVVLVVLAVVVFFVVSTLQRRGRTDPPRSLGRRGRPPAPDDDPQFLRELDDQLWRDRRNRRDQDGAADQDESGAA